MELVLGGFCFVLMEKVSLEKYEYIFFFFFLNIDKHSRIFIHGSLTIVIDHGHQQHFDKCTLFLLTIGLFSLSQISLKEKQNLKDTF